MARVETGARLHVGFQNLSLAHDRLYGGVGLALDTPRAVVTAAPAEEIHCADDRVLEYARRSVELLDVDGASITVENRFPAHVGLGSGTQLALATLAAVAVAHDREPRVRHWAPALGRGGRSGVGVAVFEQGGFVVDAGHPAAQFTADPPAVGAWTVPPVIARHDLPADWRFVVVLPETAAGRSGDREDASMRAVVERADSAVADDLATLMVRRLLPAVATGEWDAVGRALEAFGRRNGAWYADVQGGVYRPPAGTLIDRLGDSPAIAGAGQSSWGPAVYGLTTRDRADRAVEAANAALAAADEDGDVLVSAPRNVGATIE